MPKIWGSSFYKKYSVQKACFIHLGKECSGGKDTPQLQCLQQWWEMIALCAGLLGCGCGNRQRVGWFFPISERCAGQGGEHNCFFQKYDYCSWVRPESAYSGLIKWQVLLFFLGGKCQSYFVMTELECFLACS